MRDNPAGEASREQAVGGVSATVRPFPGAERAQAERLAGAAPRHNLPASLTSFVGRQQSLAELQEVLSTTRLLTLTGPPGVGKTRLALELARRLADEFAGGVWLVELAPLADPTLVPQAVATVVGVREQPGLSLVETLADALRARQVLLVLDNCEHLVTACAELGEGLLRAAPELRVLATSREALGIVGETTWRVSSLSLPDGEALAAAGFERVTAVRESAALRLFEERTRAALPGFAITSHNASVAAQVCRRLDGIPLALELAAVRVPALGVEQLAERLDDRFRLLTGGSRTALPRQQTLRATVDWSHDLLSEPERRLLRRLAVFAGGWTLAAAEAVCAGDGLEVAEVFGLLLDLVDRSLVVAEPEGQEARYRSLETLRQYGAEKLREAGEEAGVRTRHLEWFATLAEQVAPRLRGGEQGTWLAQLEREHDNFRAALAWSLAESGQDAAESSERHEPGLRLAGSLGWFWYVHSNLGEGRRWLGGVLAANDPEATGPRVRALALAGLLAENQGDYRQAEALLQESLAQARQIDDARGVARALTLLGLVSRDLGHYEEATTLLEEAIAMARGTGERWIEMAVLLWLGSVARYQGDAQRATELLEASLALSRALGDTIFTLRVLAHLGMVAHAQRQAERAMGLLEESLALAGQVGSKWGRAVALTDLGMVASSRGDTERATACYTDGLALFRDLGDRWGMARALHNLGRLTAAEGQLERAARLYVTSARLRDAIGAPPRLSERSEYEQDLADVRARLGEVAFAAASADGRAMSMERAIDDALAAVEPAAPASPPVQPVEPPVETAPAGQPSPLSRREQEVAVLIAQGLTNRQIADQLVLSEWTVDSHVRHILTKLGYRSRTQVAVWTRQQGQPGR